ncbi:hypothetical protein GcM1_088002, partial [Golovinomyces cichoracearum]
MSSLPKNFLSGMDTADIINKRRRSEKTKNESLETSHNDILNAARHDCEPSHKPPATTN